MDEPLPLKHVLFHALAAILVVGITSWVLTVLPRPPIPLGATFEFLPRHSWPLPPPTDIKVSGIALDAAPAPVTMMPPPQEVAPVVARKPNQQPCRLDPTVLRQGMGSTLLVLGRSGRSYLVDVEGSGMHDLGACPTGRLWIDEPQLMALSWATP